MSKEKKKNQASSFGSSSGERLSDNEVSEKNESNSESIFEEKFQITGLVRVLILFALSGVAYAIAYLFTKDMQFLTANIVSLLIALTVFWGVGLAMAGKSKYGIAIVVFLFLIFGIRVSTHYFIVKKQEARAAFVKDSIQQVNYLKQVAAINKAFLEAKKEQAARLSKTVPVRVLKIGTTCLDLKKDQKTEWFVFPEGEFYYSISSQNYNYWIIFTDGTKYKGGADTKIPFKIHPQLKIESLEDQLVTISVWR